MIRNAKGQFTPASVGPANTHWKGGSLSWNGYRLISVARPSGRYVQVREHRYLWEKANGPIPDGMVLHHKNGNKTDNRLENLELVTRADHVRMHRERSAPPCDVCGVPSQALRLCNRHYKQLKKYGHIPPPATLRRSGRRPSGYARNP